MSETPNTTRRLDKVEWKIDNHNERFKEVDSRLEKLSNIIELGLGKVGKELHENTAALNKRDTDIIIRVEKGFSFVAGIAAAAGAVGGLAGGILGFVIQYFTKTGA